MAQPQFRARGVFADYVPGPHGPADEDFLECQMLLARAAGIDGFLGQWTFGLPETEHNLMTVTRMALRFGVHVGATWSAVRPPDGEDTAAAASECFLRLLRDIYGTNGVRVGGHPLVLYAVPADRNLDALERERATAAQAVALVHAAGEAGYHPVIVTREAAADPEGPPVFIRIVGPRQEQCEANQWARLQASSATMALVPDWMRQCDVAVQPPSGAGFTALEEWTRRIGAWKGATPRVSLLALPGRLLALRRRTRGLAQVGVPPERVARVQQDLYDAAMSIARYGETAALALMKRAETEADRIDPRLAPGAMAPAAA